jgi:Lon-like ATP-dependent protease
MKGRAFMNNFFLEHAGTLYLIQVLITIVIGIYFWSLLQNQRSRKSTMDRESGKERLKLQQLRSIKLSEPLSSQTRPASLDDIVGQKEGVDILRSALCGSNPQHVIIYGPPGIGKTAAARLVLEEAKKNPISPFGPGAQFVEVDATISRFIFSEDARTLLAQNGFVVIPNAASEFFMVYEFNRYDSIPNFPQRCHIRAGSAPA